LDLNKARNIAVLPSGTGHAHRIIEGFGRGES
jgi:hypothetical protein